MMSYVLICMPILQYNSMKTIAFWILIQSSIVYPQFAPQLFPKESWMIHIFPLESSNMSAVARCAGEFSH